MDIQPADSSDNKVDELHSIVVLSVEGMIASSKHFFSCLTFTLKYIYYTFKKCDDGGTSVRPFDDMITVLRWSKTFVEVCGLANKSKLEPALGPGQYSPPSACNRPEQLATDFNC